MNSTILVPLDGSKASEAAIEVAHNILSKRKVAGKLYLLRALETPGMAWPSLNSDEFWGREKGWINDYLSKKKEELGDTNYQVETLTWKGPNPTQAIVEAVQQKDVKLVVMTGHGHSGWIRFMLGSVTEKAVRLCPCSVLVARQGHQDAPITTSYQRILIPLDGSKRAEAALPHALEVAHGTGAQLILVGVSVVFMGHALESDMKHVVEPDLQGIESYLGEQAEWLRNQGFDVSTEVRRGDPGHEILAVAEEEKSDLILMTSHGRTGMAHWFYGSVAERVLRYSHCGVMVVKEEN